LDDPERDVHLARLVTGRLAAGALPGRDEDGGGEGEDETESDEALDHAGRPVVARPSHGCAIGEKPLREGAPRRCIDLTSSCFPTSPTWSSKTCTPSTCSGSPRTWRRRSRRPQPRCRSARSCNRPSASDTAGAPPAGR